MTPTDIKPTPDARGSILTFRLDHAISSKGMGIAMPSVAQPGAATKSVLQEVERGWLLTFAMLVLGLTLAGARHAVLLSILFGAATACAYGLLGDFSDLLLGFWGAAVLVMAPAHLFLAWLILRLAQPASARLLAVQLLLFGLLYPCVAGLDAPRQSLYFNLAAVAFLAFAGWQLLRSIPRIGAFNRSKPRPRLQPSSTSETRGQRPAERPAAAQSTPVILRRGLAGASG